MPHPSFKRLTLPHFALAAIIMYALYNAGSLGLYIAKKYSQYKMEDLEPGMQFATFKPHLEGVREAGYLTDRATSREQISEAFLQAQYYLAPTTFTINEGPYAYAILDSQNREFIIKALQEMRATRLSNNAYGQALLKRKAP
jgi:hypothetical protein